MKDRRLSPQLRLQKRIGEKGTRICSIPTCAYSLLIRITNHREGGRFIFWRSGAFVHVRHVVHIARPTLVKIILTSLHWVENYFFSPALYQGIIFVRGSLSEYANIWRGTNVLSVVMFMSVRLSSVLSSIWIFW